MSRGVATLASVFAQRAENAEIWDVEGARYIDFAGGIGVLATGHRNPRVMAAVARQAERFTHTAFQVMAYDSYIEYAEKLNARAPFSGKAKSLFLTTGAEATENAAKLSRAYTGRNGLITFHNSFHGRTLLASAMTGKVHPYKAPFGTMPGQVFHVPFPCESYSVSTEDSLRALDLVFSADIAAEDVAAIFIEPVQGEGGFHVAPPEFLYALRALCDRHGILLVADEVQTGFGRTGRLFAISHSGVEPDLVCTAKSLAGGFPLSAVIGRAEIMDCVEPGALGGTYAGSPLACAAGLAVLDEIEEAGLLQRAEHLGQLLRHRLHALSAEPGLLPVTRIRGLGSMLAFDVVGTDAKPPYTASQAMAVSRSALEHGLIVLTCGRFGEAIRILLPLTISDATLEEGLDALQKALAETRR